MARTNTGGRGGNNRSTTNPATPATPRTPGARVNGFMEFIKKNYVPVIIVALLLIVTIVGIVAARSLRRNDDRIEAKFEGKVDTLAAAIKGAYDYAEQVGRDGKAFSKAYTDSVFNAAIDYIDGRDADLQAQLDSLRAALEKRAANANTGSGGGGYRYKVPPHSHPEMADTNYVNQKVNIANITTTTVNKPCNCPKKKRRHNKSNSTGYSDLYSFK